jgi:8-oxo-dGTP pyrophosphatase MutT (NUDIX family)
MQTKEHKTAGCYLVRENNGVWEIVLIYRKWSEENQGWVPPKGHVEDGETLEEAAKRETAEETGYTDIEIIQPIETLHIEYKGDDGLMEQKAIHYFLAKLNDSKQEALNTTDKERDTLTMVKWHSLESAEKLLKFDDEREILRKIIKIMA